MLFTRLKPPELHRATTSRERELTFDHIHIFFYHTRTWRASPMSDQLNAWTTSETTQTLKTIHIIHSDIHSNKANMKGWLWRRNGIWGSCGPKASWHLPYTLRKKPEKISPRKLFPTEDRTRARCVTDSQCTACSVAEGLLKSKQKITKICIQSVPKLFFQINTGGREHQNKYISLWYIWSLTTISDAMDDLHRR